MTYPKGYRFLNPYNFVRFLEAAEPKTAETALLGRCAPPPHDRYLGLTGRIMCTLEAVTPLFVSDTHGIEEDPQVREHKRYRFFQYGGQDAIPASTLRGVVRSVFEAVTNSCFASFRGNRLSLHMSADQVRKLVPARVEQDRTGAYQLRLLTGTTTLMVGYPPKGNLYAAWVPCYWNSASSETAATNQASGYAKRVSISIPKELEHGSACWAKIESVTRPRRGRTGPWDFWNVLQLAKDEASLGTALPGQRIVQGWLCLTGQNIPNKHDERFFFRDPANTEGPQILPLPDCVREDYENLISDYQERHSKALQDPGMRRTLSNFIKAGRDTLQCGDLVYALVSSSPSGPVVDLIAPVSVPRLNYRRSLQDILPSHLWACKSIDEEGLCPACRMFGWVYNAKLHGCSVPDKVVAYAGRVRFSHAALALDKGTMEAHVLGVLSSPKPTTTQFYLLKGCRSAFDVGYDDRDATLRGRKFYRHHDDKPIKKPVTERSSQNRTIIDARRRGNVFQFTLDFENLAPVELGALLWSLELPFEGEQGCHRLGYAKPFGFGSAKITITALQILNPESRYTSLSEEGGWQPALAAKEGWINTFRDAMEHLYSRPFASLENVRDLTALLGEPPDKPIEYPHPPSTDAENFEWFVGNKRLGSRGYVLALADKDTDGLPLLNRRGEKW